MFYFKIHLKARLAAGRVSQQISGAASPLISAQCGLQNTGMRAHKRTVEHSNLQIPYRKDSRTCVRNVQIHKNDPPRQQTSTFAYMRAHTHTHTHSCAQPQMFPHIKANSLGISSIPFWVYNGKICPLTWSIFNIHESNSQGMPCLSAERWDGLMSFIYTSAVSG